MMLCALALAEALDAEVLLVLTELVVLVLMGLKVHVQRSKSVGAVVS